MYFIFFLSLVIIFFLSWGSFLNVVAYRSICDKPFLKKRSSCNYCNKTISWYDNIPVLSWIILKAKCRLCKKPISILYPFVETLTAIVMTFLFFKFFSFKGFFIFHSQNIFPFVAYFIFFTALIIAIRTDLQALVIPQLFSLWLIPLGLLFSFLGFTQINLLQSMIGAVVGYGSLWIVAKIFKLITKKDGLGVGDMELLGFIGSFLGPLGVWFSILIGSFAGLLIGGSYLLFAKKSKMTPIPFGPFLALGATIYFFFKSYLILFFI